MIFTDIVVSVVITESVMNPIITKHGVRSGQVNLRVCKTKKKSLTVKDERKECPN